MYVVIKLESKPESPTSINDFLNYIINISSDTNE